MRVAPNFKPMVRWLACSLAFVALGCGRGSKKRDAAEEEFILAIDPDTLDPRFAVDVVGMRASRLVHAGLFRANDETLAPEPNIAASYRYRDPYTLEVDLPPLAWENGDALSSDDVVATFRALGDPRVGTRHAYLVAPIAKVEPEGKTRVVFHLKEPRGGLLSDLEFPILRKDQAGGPIDQKGALDGLGPFRVVSLAPGEVRLSPRANALHPAKHDVVLRTVRDENARALRLLAEKADVAQNAIAPSLLASLVNDGAGKLDLRRHAGATTTYLILRTAAPPLDSASYRCAIGENIDRALLTQNLLEGAATPATSLVPIGHWAHVDLLPFVPGMHKIGGEGERISIFTSTERTRMLIGRTIAERLTRVGIPTDSRPLELGTLIARLNAGQFDGAILQFPEFTDPTLLRLFLHSEAIPPAGSNRGRLRDAIVDDLLERGDRSIDFAERKAIYRALEERLRELCVMIPLWHEDNVALVAKRSRFAPTADGRYSGLAN